VGWRSTEDVHAPSGVSSAPGSPRTCTGSITRVWRRCGPGMPRGSQGGCKGQSRRGHGTCPSSRLGARRRLVLIVPPADPACAAPPAEVPRAPPAWQGSTAWEAGSRAPGRIGSSRAGDRSGQVRTPARQGGGLESRRRCLAKGQVHPQRLVILHEGRRDRMAGEGRRLRPGHRDHWGGMVWLSAALMFVPGATDSASAPAPASQRPRSL
jgi:hypothetical protein